MPLQATSGAASYDAFGGGVPVVPNYIEEVFSTWLYTGNSSTQTITNGIDLSGEGGLVWIKKRSEADNHFLFDTNRGATFRLISNATNASSDAGDSLVAFNSNGFNLDGGYTCNGSGNTLVSWTFRKQPKFFDVVTYTGNGTNGRTVAHSLGSVPACMIVKRTDASNGWAVYHRSMNASPQDYMMRLNATDGAFTTTPSRWNNTLPTSTEFTLSGNDEVNGSGGTYVAYLFAHNAGGFGLTGTDNVISCGSVTANSSGTFSVNLGYEPQWVMLKGTTSGNSWLIEDSMRGMNYSRGGYLAADSSAAEQNGVGGLWVPTATGFEMQYAYLPDQEYIYIAIRKGPMKVPTSGTSVFYPLARTGTGTATSISGVGFVPDFFLSQNRNVPGDPGPASSLSIVLSRITNLKFLRTQTTSAQGDSTEVTSWNQSGVSLSADTYGRVNDTSVNTINYFVGRAPSFMDVVCYTGTGSNITLNHNLGAVPELMIFKTRTGAARAWGVYSSAFGVNKKLILNTTAAVANDSFFVDTTPTATVFYPGNADESNEGGNTYVAYLFATCAGVSKVGSYTGTATTLQVNCGFTGGARFVLIKRTDSTGDWYVWDSARGIVSGNDPYLLLNSTAAEVTSTDYIDTYSAGFEISSTAPSAINASGGTFIFLAIA